MGPFTFQPVWVTEDVLIYAATLAVVFFIIKTEAQPVARIMEMVAFTVLDSAVYENFATVIGLYGYGHSMLMLFNVPISVPLFEYLVLYSALKLFEYTHVPSWLKPLGAGWLAVVADFTLDPVSVHQRFSTLEGTVSRWWWNLGDGWVQIYDEPVKNFTGWMAIIGWAAVTALLGRAWHRRSGYKPWVGVVYPIIAAVVALGLTMSPLTSMLLMFSPVLPAGTAFEWVGLGLSLVVPPVLFALFWRGRMRPGLSVRTHWPVFAALGAFPVINLGFTLAGGDWEILWLEILGTVVMEAVLALFVIRSTRATSEVNDHQLRTPDLSAARAPGR
ncbi:carotenoid biosynthesis protein [Curtobacterium sp. VKM Ac-2887]|uniref:carotenoid biosynthesis protein n=1 Tax=Curtobacterium sp. VKM Ac-2887 TaxID=2783819 RepID=UPI00188C9B27|nr:carotenoid biosynthesis protein [Curtobacterium sp. VKM Ac-2887]MBF4585692.1 carotenoid biosynthesis protein [Curtobacterium sp. VKM Ac-2887]